MTAMLYASATALTVVSLISEVFQDLLFPNDAAIFAYREQALQRAIVILLRRGSLTPWARGLVEED